MTFCESDISTDLDMIDKYHLSFPMLKQII